jgi:hypothetical protein
MICRLEDMAGPEHLNSVGLRGIKYVLYFFKMKLLMSYFYSKIIVNNRRGNVLEEIHAFLLVVLIGANPLSLLSHSRWERRV